MVARFLLTFLVVSLVLLGAKMTTFCSDFAQNRNFLQVRD